MGVLGLVRRRPIRKWSFSYLPSKTNPSRNQKHPLSFITAKTAKTLKEIEPDLLRILVLIPLKVEQNSQFLEKLKWLEFCATSREICTRILSKSRSFSLEFLAVFAVDVLHEENWVGIFFRCFIFLLGGNYPTHVLCQSGKLLPGAYFGRRYSRQSPQLLLPSELRTLHS